MTNQNKNIENSSDTPIKSSKERMATQRRKTLYPILASVALIASAVGGIKAVEAANHYVPVDAQANYVLPNQDAISVVNQSEREIAHDNGLDYEEISGGTYSAIHEVGDTKSGDKILTTVEVNDFGQYKARAEKVHTDVEQ